MAPNKRVRSNRIVFTLNNPTDEECLQLTSKLTDLSGNGFVNYAIIGREHAPTTNTLHLQGYINLKASYLKATSGTPTKWRSLIPSLARAHMENACGTDSDSQKYCSKENVILELGTPTTSLETQWTRLSQVQSMEEAIEIDAEVAVRCRFQIKDIALANFLQEHSRPAQMSTTLLFKWQTAVLQSLFAQNDRKITWVVDPRGGTGKSTLARFLQYHLGDLCYYTTGGKGSDIVHSMVARQKVFKYVIFDYPRKTKPEFYNWNLFEDFKNGIVNSGKYNSVCLQFPSIKVLVLGNHPLDDVRDNLTFDRWDVHTLSEHAPELGAPTVDPKTVFQRTDLFPDLPLPTEEEPMMTDEDIVNMLLNDDLDALVNDLINE